MSFQRTTSTHNQLSFLTTPPPPRPPSQPCPLIEMNQVTAPDAYVPLGQSILQNMGVGTEVVSAAALQGIAAKARGSLRDYTHDVVMQGIEYGGVMP